MELLAESSTCGREYIGYDKNCNRYPAAQYHEHRGNIYVTSEIPDKGPVSVIFHPNSNRSALTFTSARTHKNAVMERLAGSKCRVQRLTIRSSRPW